MSNESVFQGQPAYVQKTSNKKRLVIIFLVVLVLVIAALGALYLLGSSAKHTTNPTNPIPTETISAMPTSASTAAQLSSTPVPSSAVNVSTLKVSVLNGSGIPGVAQKVASALTTAGYANVTTGNATAFTYTGITIHVKKSEYLSAVQKDIVTTNPSVKVTTGVDTTIARDVEVIVGK